jgi:DNA repair photolyase
MIVSVSRRTDIPAFYSDWFFNRLREGFVYVRNPFNHKQVSKISLLPRSVDCFVFWTKNPAPFLERLDELKDFYFYFQFTITPYDNDLEPFVPDREKLINTFIKLSKLIGRERVIWRYDPILISEKYTVDFHIKNFESIAKEVGLFTEKCIISFFDFYKKCERNLEGTDVREPTEEEIFLISKKLKEISVQYNLTLETCAESVELEQYGIGHGRCIDNILIEKILGQKVKGSKDKYQRDACGCIESIDIGAYNTCEYGCLYCYANHSQTVVSGNIKNHSATSPFLIGNIEENDIIKERKNRSIII